MTKGYKDPSYKERMVARRARQDALKGSLRDFPGDSVKTLLLAYGKYIPAGVHKNV